MRNDWYPGDTAYLEGHGGGGLESYTPLTVLAVRRTEVLVRCGALTYWERPRFLRSAAELQPGVPILDSASPNLYPGGYA